MDLKKEQPRVLAKLAHLENLRDACTKSARSVPPELVDAIDESMEVVRQCRDAEAGNWWTLYGLYGLGELMMCKRYAAGMNQRDVAKKIGYAQSRYCVLEQGEFLEMKLKDVIATCEAIGLKIRIDVVDERETTDE
jgi:DNA-binding XRE family transcriptional regulator